MLERSAAFHIGSSVSVFLLMVQAGQGKTPEILPTINALYTQTRQIKINMMGRCPFARREQNGVDSSTVPGRDRELGACQTEGLEVSRTLCA